VAPSQARIAPFSSKRWLPANPRPQASAATGFPRHRRVGGFRRPGRLDPQGAGGLGRTHRPLLACGGGFALGGQGDPAFPVARTARAHLACPARRISGSCRTGRAVNAAFPAALKEDPSEPLWIDARKGTESRERIFARIAAGLLDVSFDQIWKRQQRQARNRMVAAVAAGLIIGLPLAAFGWEFSQPIQIGACPLDKLVFEAGWLKGQDVSHRFAVSRVGVRYWGNCEDGQKPWTDALASDINCRGPYGETVFEGEYRAPGDTATRKDVYPIWSIEPAAPCCMWNIFSKETAGEIIADENFHWYSGGKAPQLSTLPFNSIEVDRYSTNEFESENLGLENELPASACAVDFAGRFGMFTTRVAGWFAPKAPDEILEEETPP
jgi:hypothetical protein